MADDQGNRPSGLSPSDKLGIALACLSGALAIPLYLVEKTPYSVAGLLTLMVALCVYPILHFAKSRNVRIVLGILLVIGTVILGRVEWPKTKLSVAQVGSGTSSGLSGNQSGSAYNSGLSQSAEDKSSSNADTKKGAPPGPKKASKGIRVGNDSVAVGNISDGSKIGDRSVVVGPTDSNGNTILNRGGTAIGKGAKADATSIAIGENANAGGPVTNAGDSHGGSVGGNITQGPCSVTQIGGSSNQASVNCTPPSPRLSPDQKDSLVACLRTNPGKFGIVALSNNEKAYRYAKDWYEVFSSAEWVNQQPIPIGSMLVYEPVPNGLEFIIHGNIDDVSKNVSLVKGSPEVTLYECVNKTSILAKFTADNDRTTGSIWITVGDRPIE
jgi:hypothetical protein